MLIIVAAAATLTVLSHQYTPDTSGIAATATRAVPAILTTQPKPAPQSSQYEVPPQLAKVLGAAHVKYTLQGADDELLTSVGLGPDFLDKYESLGEPEVSPEDLRQDLVNLGYANIKGMLSKDVAAEVRRFILSLLNEPDVVWKPNEGDKIETQTVGRVMMGLHPRHYKPLERIMTSPQMMKYMSHLMPCQGKPASSDKFKILQVFSTVNDRIRWHVDYPNQPPMKDGKTTMYSEDFCQYKTIFYLQDHTLEDEGNPSALMVVPNTHNEEPHWTKCSKANCSFARKGMVPSEEYKSVNLSPDLGDLLVMDARALHTAADVSLTLPIPPRATPRKHKYRVFLQFLFGIEKNPLSDVMQKKKDKNFVTKHFKKKVFP